MSAAPQEITSLVARLRAAGCVFAEEEAALLTGSASGERLEQLVARRTAGEPLEHLLGFVEFCGRRYRVAPGVFIPRQRSALLVEEAVRLGRAAPTGPAGPVVLDLCCGCGALGLAVAGRLGRSATLHAADLDPDAVRCARGNGVAHAYVGDLFEPLPRALRGRVHLLLANTPYVPTAAIADMPAESRDHEPRHTVDGGPDGMDLQRAVLAAAGDWLATDGHLLTETSTRQAPVLAGLATSAGLRARVVHDDELGATVLVATAT